MNKTLCLAVASAAALLTAANMMGVRLNFTGSAPRGLWIEEPVAPSTIKRGMFVSVCPPPAPVVKAVAEFGGMVAGDCPSLGVAPLLKPVGAIPGDSVRLYKGRSIAVNGITLPNTVSISDIPAFPDGEYIVKPGQVWLFSNYNANSFDSRYFGPVDIQQVRGKAVPFLTTGGHDA